MSFANPSWGYFHPSLAPVPSRTCVGVHGLAVGALVEVDLVAWCAEGWPA